MRRGFTLIELVIVIVVIGILAKFGTNLLATAYESYTSSTINNRLQADTELTLKQISNRLQYRIKDSVIARPGPVALASATGNTYTTLEWIGYDIDGWLGLDNDAGFNSPTWSGFIDVNTTAAITAKTYLQSPGTDTTDANTVITAVSQGSTFADAAIFFTGANSDIQSDYGWTGALTDQSGAAHQVKAVAAVTQLAATGATSFTGVDVYENYKLAWTAYAVRIEDFDSDGGNDLVLYYDYQPWKGEGFAAGTKELLLENVDTFKFSASGDTIKVQICVNEQNTLGGGLYAICKETAIF